jgi:hypothetical protein
MKLKVTHTVVYDTQDKEFMEEYFQYMDDHRKTLASFEEFIIDRFINPNFDKGGKTSVEVLELLNCARCGTLVEFNGMVSNDEYYAYCPTHDEDLYRVECM